MWCPLSILTVITLESDSFIKYKEDRIEAQRMVKKRGDGKGVGNTCYRRA